MTYAISDKLPTWPGDEHAFEAKTVATPEKDGYFARGFWMLEHFGTHMDAPAHFPPGKLTLDQIPVAHFFGPAEVIDVREEVTKNADYRLTAARVEKWEADHGRIPAGAIVLLRTGWDSRWPDQARYRNSDAQGSMHFPGFSTEAAKLLISRGAVGLGIDTLSIDYGPSKDFEVHRTDLPAGLFNLENVANLGKLPETGAFLIVGANQAGRRLGRSRSHLRDSAVMVGDADYCVGLLPPRALFRKPPPTLGHCPQRPPLGSRSWMA